ncbi:PREDICTED: phosphoglycerate mutase-like protein AT74 isoform X2 [Nicotiana attenuata]|uniref:phosphoglycerate mutase-like protein AT74 isoform X2 n=1 Tax=Nicotiana attenuata TaxID=49451 RepID=UPI000905776A|nr:PREDICTED: phosphoglycerate mutase-like protein AT74 isoform X2 [Nicotiana attenuata]
MSNLFSKIYPTSFGLNHQKLYPNSSTIRCCDNEYSEVQHKSAEVNGWVSSFPEKNLVLSYPGIVKPPRPKRIILVRHGQSEGNVDESVYTRVADPKVGLTEKGVEEAEECGRKMREIIEKNDGDDWKVYFYVSPYKRGIETLRNLAKSFERSRIAGVREEPRLREQDFGNFQDKEQMKIEKAVRARYGRFFYRFPNGESAADVYDRITGFRETLRSDIDIGRFQPPVEQFEGLHNMSNGGMIVMERGYGGRYCLSVHHTREELQKFGMTDEMLTDQEWQKIAKPGELNYDCLITGPSYFTHFDDDEAKNFEL